MAIDVVKYESSGVRFELEQRPSKALRKFGNGRLTIYLGGEPIWITHQADRMHGIEWTWSDLLSFLTSNWAWLLNEQGLPLPVKYFPDILSGTAADIWEKLSQKNSIELTKEQKRSLRTFCQRHNLAEASSGIVLPSLFLLRIGNQLLFSSEKKQILINIQDGYQLLSQVGDTIYRWMEPYADGGTQPLLDAWKTRDQRVKEIITSKEYLLARMDRDSFNVLSRQMNHQWNNTWDGSIMRESEIFAAARMSAGFVPISQQIDILNIIKTCPAINTERINVLSNYLCNFYLLISESSEKDTKTLQDYVIGYALADELRKYLHVEDDNSLNPEDIINNIGVYIYERKWLETPIDALSCWSDNHGPLIILNVADGKRCSHEYGRRFTLGHELCHLLIDRGNSLGLVDIFGYGMPSFMERRASAFAAELLLPRDLAFIEFQKNDDESSTFLLYLRNKYKVPRKTAASQVFNSLARTIMTSSEYEFFENEVYGKNDEDVN